MSGPENTKAGEATLSRREALIRLLRVAGVGAGAAGFSVWLSHQSSRPEIAVAANVKRGHTVAANAALPELAIIEGEDPAQLARQALEELGGMKRFVSRGDIVLVKPNIGWDRTPEQRRTRIRMLLRKLCASACSPVRNESSSPT